MTNEYGNLELHKVLLKAMKDFDKICRDNGLKYYLYAGSVLGAVNHKGFIPWDDDVDIVMFPEDYKRFCEIIQKEYSDIYRMMTFENTKEWYSQMSKMQVLGAYFITGDSKHTPIFIDVSELHSVPDNKILRLIQRKQIEWLNLCLNVLSGGIITSSLLSKCTIGLYSKLGKDRLGNQLKSVMCRYDGKKTEYVGIMCNTLTKSPYTGKTGYDADCTKKAWYSKQVYLPFEDTEFPTFSNYEEDLIYLYGKDYMKPYPEEKRITKHDVKEYIIEPWVMERIK